jgi:hypothetical protein
MDKILYWKSIVFAGLALLLFICNVVMIRSNQAIQAQINERQNVINVAANVAPLNQQLSQTLFEVSEKTNDGRIRDLLTSQGFVLPEKAAAKAKAEAASKKSQKEED